MDEIKEYQALAEELEQFFGDLTIRQLGGGETQEEPAEGEDQPKEEGEQPPAEEEKKENEGAVEV